MKLKRFSLIAMSLVMGGLCVQPTAWAQDPKNKKQMQQLAYDYCTKTSKPDVCNCFSESLVKGFNEKEWSLFIADATNNDYSNDVSQSDVDSYGNKIAAAGRTCGVR